MRDLDEALKEFKIDDAGEGMCDPRFTKVHFQFQLIQRI